MPHSPTVRNPLEDMNDTVNQSVLRSNDSSSVLRSIQFTDLYLGNDATWLSGVPGTMDPIAAPAEWGVCLGELRDLCQQNSVSTSREEFAVTHEDVTFRCSILRTLDEDVFVLRRFPEQVPDVESLGIHPEYVKALLKQGLTGLVLVAGAFGQGKTTTASAIVKSRIEKFGGVAVCIEDPPEMPLQGRHGEGVIYQRWAEEGGFANECRKAARWAPSIIFVGEIRDTDTAKEALKASINGRLAVATIHSDSARTAVDRLFTLASAKSANSDDVASLMGSGLRVVMHQKLEGSPKKHIKVEYLSLDGDDQIAIRGLIRSRKFTQLDSAIQQQRNQMLLNPTRSAGSQ